MNIAVPAAPDYASDRAWAFAPEHPDRPDRAVDVFFAPGTLLSGVGMAYYDPADPAQRALARRPHLTQASAFAAAGNIFQPHCRQVSMEMNLLPRPELERAYAVPCADMRDAFRHYLDRWNRGRPFLLAGHSQGAILLLELMKSALAEPGIQTRLVAAYLIGYSVTAADLAAHSGLRLASGPDDTGVIVTYNTLAKGATRGLTLLPGALCVNPLNWVNTPDYAPADRHLGMVEFDDEGNLVREVPRFTDAWIDPALGALVVGVCDLTAAELSDGGACPAMPGGPGDCFPPGDLHRRNISFFYRNLEENARRRARAWRRRHGGGQYLSPGE